MMCGWAVQTLMYAAQAEAEVAAAALAVVSKLSASRQTTDRVLVGLLEQLRLCSGSGHPMMA